MAYLFIWILCAIGAACIAKHKGRSPGGWFCLGLIFGMFALLVAVLPSREAQDAAQARMIGAAGDFRRCPVCAEAIRVAAQKCRYCQSDVGAAVITRLPYGARSQEEMQRNLARLGPQWQEKPRKVSP